MFGDLRQALGAVFEICRGVDGRGAVERAVVNVIVRERTG